MLTRVAGSARLVGAGRRFAGGAAATGADHKGRFGYVSVYHSFQAL